MRRRAATLRAVFVRMACPISALQRIGAMAAASVAFTTPVIAGPFWREPREGRAMRRRYPAGVAATTTAASNRTRLGGDHDQRRVQALPHGAQGRRGISAPIAQEVGSLGHPRGDAAHKPAVEEIPLPAIKPTSREWRVSPQTPVLPKATLLGALSPIEASEAAIRNGCSTSTPGVAG